MAGITEIIHQLNDNAMATVDIPLKEGEDQRLNCIFKKTDAPSFTLVFAPNALDSVTIEDKTNCRLIVKHGDSAINLNIRIDAITNERTVECTALESISPESMREYFRVMISVPIRAAYKPGPREIKNKAWEISGNTIDLSGGGVLALFSEKPANTNRIQLEIDLPDQEAPVLCMAKVVRTYRLRKKRFQVAFNITEIEGKARDIIISSCLQEQRRQLRNKVRVE
ncbi:MAG TPA: PilZ domain-containing protein [Desulfobulbus sp.]|nr:PilZ domain-containing protein [Desulfobulbus sp.]